MGIYECQCQCGTAFAPFSASMMAFAFRIASAIASSTGSPVVSGCGERWCGFGCGSDWRSARTLSANPSPTEKPPFDARRDGPRACWTCPAGGAVRARRRPAARRARRAAGSPRAPRSPSGVCRGVGPARRAPSPPPPRRGRPRARRRPLLRRGPRPRACELVDLARGRSALGAAPPPYGEGAAAAARSCARAARRSSRSRARPRESPPSRSIVPLSYRSRRSRAGRRRRARRRRRPSGGNRRRAAARRRAPRRRGGRGCRARGDASDACDDDAAAPSRADAPAARGLRRLERAQEAAREPVRRARPARRRGRARRRGLRGARARGRAEARRRAVRRARRLERRGDRRLDAG